MRKIEEESQLQKFAIDVSRYEVHIRCIIIYVASILWARFKKKKRLTYVYVFMHDECNIVWYL